MADNDALQTSNSNVRLAQYTSTSDIQASFSDALLDQDVMIISGANGVWNDKIDIRSTLDSDDTVSTSYNSASAIAKVAAINDASQFTGVYATVEPTVVTASADIAAVDFDSNNYIAINGQIISGISVEDNDATSTLVNAINSETNTTGVNATLNHNNRLVLTAPDGRNIEISVAGIGTRVGLAAGAGTTVTGGRITLTSNETFSLAGSAIDKLGNIGGNGATIFPSVKVDETENLRSAINAYSNETGVYASLNEDNRLVLTAPDGRNIEISVSGIATRTGLAAAGGTTVYGGKLILSSDSPFNLTGNAIDKLGNIGADGMTEFGD